MLSDKKAFVHVENFSSYAYEEVKKENELPYAKNLLWMVFANSRGGQNRIRMISALKKSSRNAHQLAKELALNYRAIQHHISVLEKNNLVSHVGEKYGTIYFLSNFLEANITIYNNLVKNLSENK